MQLSKRCLYTLMIVVGCMSSHFSYGQYFFESFDNGCTNTNTICYLMTDCSPTTWYASHGSPSHVNSSIQEVKLGAHSTDGEGIFCEYNFRRGRKYKITFRFKSTTSGSNWGTLWSYAADGISEDPSPLQPCFRPTPSPLQTEPILENVQGQNNAWVTYYTFFEPDQDHNYFWIYSTGKDVYLDWVEIKIPCSSDEVFNNDDVLPGGLSELANSIRAGSKEAGGNSVLTVTIDGDDETELKAGEYVQFTQNFSAVPTADGHMVAGIAPCGQSFSFKKGATPLNLKDPIEDDEAERLTISQSLLTGEPILKLSLDGENEVDLIVVNEIGQIMYSSQGVRMLSGQNEIPIPTNRLKSGFYIAVVKVEGQKMTRKFVIP